MSNQTLYRPKEVAELLGVSVPLVYKIISAGKLPHFAIEGAIRVDPEDLENYKSERRTVGTPPERRNPKKGRRPLKRG